MSTYEQQPQEFSQQQQGDASTEWEDYLDQAFGDRPAPQVPQGSYVPEGPREVIPPEIAHELEALRNDNFERQVNDLVAEFPALSEPEVAQEVVTAAQRFAQEIGQPEAWRDPALIRDMIEASGGVETFGRSGQQVAQGILKAAGKSPTDFRWW